MLLIVRNHPLMWHFDGNGPLQLVVVGEIDAAETSPSQQPLDTIAADLLEGVVKTWCGSGLLRLRRIRSAVFLRLIGCAGCRRAASRFFEPAVRHCLAVDCSQSRRRLRTVDIWLGVSSNDFD